MVILLETGRRGEGKKTRAVYENRVTERGEREGGYPNIPGSETKPWLGFINTRDIGTGNESILFLLVF